MYSVMPDFSETEKPKIPLQQEYKKPKGAKVDPGPIFTTATAMKALEKAGQNPSEFLDRHLMGDWGLIDKVRPDGKEYNDLMLQYGEMVLSIYKTKKNDMIWVFTEDGKTTICLEFEG